MTGPEGKVFFTLVFLDLQVHGLAILICLPYQVSPSIQDHWARVLDRFALWGNKDEAVVAFVVPSYLLKVWGCQVEGDIIPLWITAIDGKVKECGFQGRKDPADDRKHELVDRE